MIFKDGAGQGFILFRILCNDRLMWVIVAVSADYRGFRPLQGSLPQSHRSWAPWWHGHTTDIVLEIVSLLLQPLPLPLSTSEPVSKSQSAAFWRILPGVGIAFKTLLIINFMCVCKSCLCEVFTLVDLLLGSNRLQAQFPLKPSNTLMSFIRFFQWHGASTTSLDEQII